MWGGLFALCLALPACERGCVWRLVPGEGLATGPRGVAEAWFGGGDVDCADGLARCQGGVLEASQAARRPLACQGRPEACACPWSVVGRCPGACVADGLELPLPRERAAAQLCAREQGALPTGRPPTATTTLPPLGDACEADAFVCLGSAVVACRPTPRVAGTCVAACASPDPLGGRVAESLSDTQAVAVLCAR